MGFQVVEGPEVEVGPVQLRDAEYPEGPPRPETCGTRYGSTTPTRRAKGRYFCGRTPRRCRPGPWRRRTRPVRVVVPGKCYRYEATDATHEWHIYQVEGLAVDQGITFADLKGTLFEFARRLFGAERRVRFRCDYFPFVEPGVDMSIDCFACSGGGCRICSEDGLDRDHGRREGPPEGPGGRRVRSRCLHRASPSAWGRSASPCSGTGSTIYASSTPTISAF